MRLALIFMLSILLAQPALAITDEQLLELDSENMTRIIDIAKNTGSYHQRFTDVLNVCMSEYSPIGECENIIEQYGIMLRELFRNNSNDIETILYG